VDVQVIASPWRLIWGVLLAPQCGAGEPERADDLARAENGL